VVVAKPQNLSRTAPGKAGIAFGSAPSWCSLPRRPWLLGKPYFADPARDLLRQASDLKASREAFLAARFNNLDYLLRERYSWMRDWLSPGATVAELGAGAGFASLYLDCELILTDVVENRWIGAVMDATQTAFCSGSLDAVIMSNVLHHVAAPARFLDEANRILKPGGLVLINEAYASLLLRTVLRVSRHEGYSYDVDVFDHDAIANDPRNPWSGNNAISNMLFDAKESFERRFPDFELMLDAPHECVLFLASGGVTAKAPVPKLPTAVLHGIALLDRVLTNMAPQLFALSRKTVLRKRSNA
jgi:SAM-dependent methyltransferase